MNWLWIVQCKYFMSYTIKQMAKHFTKHCMKRPAFYVSPPRVYRRFPCLLLLPIITLSACFHDALDHDCPDGMKRGPNYICEPVHSPSAPQTSTEGPRAQGDGDRESTPPTRCPEKPASIAFHEVLIDPEGPDEGREWVDLFVEEAGLLDGAKIVIRDTLLDDPSMEIALRGEVDANQLVLVADNTSEGITFGCKTHGGCLRNTGGVLELQSCEGEVLEQIVWGYAASDGLKSASGYSLAWCESEERWAQSHPHPGEHDAQWRNEDQCSAPCEVPDRLVFNEVLYDLVGPDGGAEFIELVGAPNMDISQVTLWAINGHDGEPFIPKMELEGQTDEDGFFIIGGDEIDGRDHTLSGQLQNGPEALYLEACDGTWLDAMTYGGYTDHLEPYGEASPELPPGQSLGRWPDGAAETGTMDDFVGMEPTLRAPNLPLEE